MKNQKQMQTKAQKIGIILLIVLSLILIITAISMLFLQGNEKLGKDTEKGNKNDLEEIRISKNSSFQQRVFTYFYDILERDSSDENRPFEKSPISLEDLELEEEYSDCSGTLEFSGDHIKKWSFKTNCKENDLNNMESNFISTKDRNLEITNFQKVKNGYILTTTSSEHTLGFHYLNQELQIVWEKYLSDSNATTISTDFVETTDGFYATGYLKNVSGGDFEPYVTTTGNFAYLIKFNFSGDLLTFINLDTLAKTSISRGLKIEQQKGNQIILKTDDQVLLLTDDRDIETIDFSNKDVSIEGISDNNYLAMKEKEITVEGHTAQVTDVQLLNQDGTVKWTVESSTLANCQEHECYITQFIALADSYAIAMENKVYILNQDGKTIKTLDYTDLSNSGSEVQPTTKVTVVPLEKSYLTITYPSSKTIHIEEYNLKHQLITKKTYQAPNVFWICNNSDEIKWYYQNNTLEINAILLEPLSTVAFIHLSEMND